MHIFAWLCTYEKMQRLAIELIAHLCISLQIYLVASTGIEPVSGASETLILSIVLRGRIALFQQTRSIGRKYFYGNGQQYYAKKFSYRYQPTRSQ